MEIGLSDGGWTVVLSDNGSIRSLSGPRGVALLCTDQAPFSMNIGATAVAAGPTSLLHRSTTEAGFETILKTHSPCAVRIHYTLSGKSEESALLIARVECTTIQPLPSDVVFRWTFGCRVGGQVSVFAPMFDGRGLHAASGNERIWYYKATGSEESGERLAIPLLEECTASSGPVVGWFADPFFGCTIRQYTDRPLEFGTVFLCAVGANQCAQRVFGMNIHHTRPGGSIETFFRAVVSPGPEGPPWLQDIAMVHYDYLSEGGDGWYRDIDRLCSLIAPPDRHRVVLTLHGWYDFLGRYAFDHRSSAFDREWTAMKRSSRTMMTMTDLLRRIDYGKERGFRVLLYFADGLAIDAGAPSFTPDVVFREPDGSLRRHTWSGPDTINQTYVMNPLHPGVAAFFREYLNALLQAAGNHIDGLVWDETFTIHAGDVSSKPYQGYADRAFMLLCRELRGHVKQFRQDLAFLGSDCAGFAIPLDDGTTWRADPAQNALVFDGTFQDSHCNPRAWQYGLFPNFSRVLWSCNWHPVSRFEWMATGVHVFGVPVAISNGWGDNKGVSQYSEAETKDLMDLFDVSKQRRHRVRWIDSLEAS